MHRFDLGVAIPNYNNARYLEKCIESIENQTYKDIKILVVDDQSTDGSIDILKRLCLKYKNLSYRVNNKNRGVSYTRDRAIRELDATYITAIDSDDFYYNTKKLENEMKLIMKYKKRGEDIVAYSNIISTDSDGKFKGRNINEHNLCNGECFKNFITRKSRIPTCSVYAKSLYEKVGGFDDKIEMYEDWDFKIRLAKIARFYYTNEDGFAYRHHNYGLSSVKKQKHEKWINYVFDKNTIGLENRNLLKEELYSILHPPLHKRIIRKLKRILPL